MYKILIVTRVHDTYKGGISVAQIVESFDTHEQAELAKRKIASLQTPRYANTMTIDVVPLY